MVDKWVWMGVAGAIVGYATFANLSTTTHTTSTASETHSAAPLSMQNEQGGATKRIVHDQVMQFEGEGGTAFGFEEGRKLYISIKNTGKRPIQYKIESSATSDLQGQTEGLSSRKLQPGERHDLLFVKPEGQNGDESQSSNELFLHVVTDDGSKGSVKTFAYITL
ncbi:hypothetical protein ACWHAM_13735 [Paenibacillus terrae]|uniref:Uncharacterized protein n=1 Tax=Paenibacillus terrae (strain HPL-003) TaxID=985665 RepID=G7W3G2_PAETH|nr:hypothetical protein [Paenibacillus terrae]AET57425.1 hypothetical protein HPL003_03225 [Paenibacillus terrae HPL-003]